MFKLKQQHNKIQKGKKNLLAKFVRNIGEIPLLPVINHHAQAVRVTIGSWYETKCRRENLKNTHIYIILNMKPTLFRVVGIRYNSKNIKYSTREQYTCNMNWSPHEAVVIEETGRPLSQEHLNTAGVAFLGSQVEHRTACSILHVHIGCSLSQHTQCLPMALISLRDHRKSVTTSAFSQD